MKFIFTTFFLLLVVLPITAQHDKQYLLDYFAQTENRLQEDIAGLSSAQMLYKATPESWSISQCLEHIILTEKMIFDMIKTNLEQPVNTALGVPVNTDEQIQTMVTDRSSKHKAPEALVPEGKYTSPDAALSDLQSGRMEIFALIDATPDASLRSHVSETPAGVVDAYQNLLFLAGHTARHTLQIEEVKAEPGFQKL
ncbi:DinB family protein [Aequorivita sp. SDUM287046]|uniref:DinB family protein n=1 Tax=Aequorivita aurantiaca TaxID=3053356 RepID=A0ABT8DID7_9FLAO|nr:DinB family protein [Aequorivita aurantiaca]MDN3725103.1 DinB family protein [Aequorivita aurantiaca]